MSPLLWPSGHQGLPRTFIQVAGADPLRDDALIYEKALRTESGVETRLEVYNGVPHAFDMAFPLLSLSKKFLGDKVEGYKWLLEKRW
jgi:acetyl esterase/lipase